MPKQLRRARRVAVALTAVAVLAGTAACGNGDTSDLPPAASPPQDATTELTPGLDLSPAEQQAVDEALAKFDQFMNAYIDVSTADIPTAETAEELFGQVDQHVGRELSSELRTEIVQLTWSERQVVDGTVRWDLSEIADVDLDREVDGKSSPQVDLRYCVDRTDWIRVDVDTGEPVESPGTRQLWSVNVVWWDDWGGLGQGPEGWRVVGREPHGGQPC